MGLFADSENSAEPDGVTHGIGAVAQFRVHPANVKAIVAFASARGGVGKSSLGVNLAVAMALKGRKVGILDADLNSPCIAAMLGMRRIHAFQAAGVIEPAAGPLGLRVIGSDLLNNGSPAISVFDSDDAAPEPPEPAVLTDVEKLNRMLAETRFGALDLLLIDLPAGLEYFKRIAAQADLSGVVFVTQSSDLALRGTRTAIDAAAKSSTPLLGIVENMTGFYCGHCQSVRPLFPNGDTMGLRRELESSLLARLPFDTRLAESCDRGVAFVRQYAESPLAKEITALAEKLEQALAARTQTAGATVPA
jgi:ATP-binding protein involved in chromosome partitioning